jgi:hypothetical protein
MPHFRVEIVGWVDTAHPGWVECRFIDAHGVGHALVDKVPVVTTDRMSEHTHFPCEGEVRCTLL